MQRYSLITEKRQREIVLLRGSGCKYARCSFCDYHFDKCEDENANFELNSRVLSRVTGLYGDLEVINSGSVWELDDRTLALIKEICLSKNISTLHFEAHWLYRDKIPALRAYFAPIELKMKLGLETFDYDLRERVLNKGISERDPEKIARDFDEANLLFGISGQDEESMRRDVTLGLKLFERICINIFCRNSTSVEPDEDVIGEFMEELYFESQSDPRVDVLMENTDFGVGD